MTRIAMGIAEHGVVMPCGTTDRIPEAAATVKRMGIRMLYYGWPGMTRLPDGELLVSASEGILHVDPFRRDVLVRSPDKGRTWSGPEIVFDSITDDRDIALNTLHDGTLTASWFSSKIWANPKPWTWMQPEWEAHRDLCKPDTLTALHRGWLRHSFDGGRTWSDLLHPTLVGQHAGPTVLSNGDMIYCGPYSVEDGSTMVATLSKDGGRSWSIAGEIDAPRLYDDVTRKRWSELTENHSIETSPGRILTVFRSGSKEMFTARSEDFGCTWTQPRQMGINGYPPYLMRLSAGPILCVYTRRDRPRGIGGVISYDDGKTWDIENRFAIRAFDHIDNGVDIGYPVVLETEPAELFCVYYANPTLKTADYAAYDPYEWGILSTRFTLKQGTDDES